MIMSSYNEKVRHTKAADETTEQTPTKAADYTNEQHNVKIMIQQTDNTIGNNNDEQDIDYMSQFNMGSMSGTRSNAGHDINRNFNDR